MASLGSWSEAARDRFQGGRPLAERRPVSHPSTQRCFVYVRAVTTSEDAVARLRAAIAKLEPGEDRPPTQDGDVWVELLRVTLDGWAEALERDLRRADAALAAINKLKRDRMLTPGFAYRLRWRRNGEETGTAGLVCDSTMRIRLLYRLEGPYVGEIGLDGRELAEILEDRDLDDSWFFYPVWIVHTICHLGGWRPWFRCLAEGCGRRVGKLYLGNRHFFYRLRYACQREHEWGPPATPPREA